MGFLKKLFESVQSTPPPPRKPPQPRTVRKDAEVTLYTGEVSLLDVKGESRYQKELAMIAGPKKEDGHNFPIHAVLLREPDNEYDENAIAVYATRTTPGFPARKVGYVSRDEAELLAPEIDLKNRQGEVVAVEGFIRGGWDRGGGDTGHYGLYLAFDPADFDLDPGEFEEPYEPAALIPEEELIWVVGRPEHRTKAISSRRKRLEELSKPLLRHDLFMELEVILDESSDVLGPDQFFEVCEMHHAEMPQIRAALIDKHGGLPYLSLYRDAAVARWRLDDFAGALAWAERGLEVYGDQALDASHVDDLNKRVERYKKKSGSS